MCSHTQEDEFKCGLYINKHEVMIYEWEDGRFTGSKSRIYKDSDGLEIRQSSKDNRWYAIDFIDDWSPFTDLIEMLVGNIK